LGGGGGRCAAGAGLRGRGLDSLGSLGLGGVLHHEPVSITLHHNILYVGQHLALACLVGLAGQLHVHVQEALVHLLYETDRLLLGQLHGFQQGSHFGQYPLEGGERLAFLWIPVAHPVALLLVGLAVSTIVATISISLGHVSFLS
jgi:hypothetical protein